MRTLSNIVHDVIAVINNIDIFPVNAVSLFESRLMDMPLYFPLAAVGINTASLHTDKLSTYYRTSGGTEKYAVPADVELLIEIYLPHTASGYVNYDAACHIIFALMESSIQVSDVSFGTMHYESTQICTVMPMTVKVHDRVCED